jgi:[ribosomal protein S5]-alanine N-acetyltransferase
MNGREQEGSQLSDTCACLLSPGKLLVVADNLAAEVSIVMNTPADPPILQTARLVLRPLRLEDAPDYFEFSSDPEVVRFLSRPPHSTVDEARQRVAEILAPELLDAHKRWAIVPVGSTKMIGSCALHLEAEVHRRAEISYLLNRAYWGHGYMPEAVRALLEYGFQERELNRIDAMCVAANEASERVMQKVGMRYEGTLRQYLFTRGQFWDMKLYSILRDEWRATLPAAR